MQKMLISSLDYLFQIEIKKQFCNISSGKNGRHSFVWLTEQKVNSRNVLIKIGFVNMLCTLWISVSVDVAFNFLLHLQQQNSIPCSNSIDMASVMLFLLIKSCSHFIVLSEPHICCCCCYYQLCFAFAAIVIFIA